VRNGTVDFESLSGDLRSLQARALEEIAAAADPPALDALQIQYLGKKGDLTAVLRGIGALPAGDRPRVGAIANDVGEAVKGALAARGVELRGQVQALRLASETVDVTLPGRPVGRGALHPIPETIAAIAEVFGQFGFVVYEGPRSKTISPTSRCSTSPPTIRRATCGTPSTWTSRATCCGPTPARVRSA